MVLFDWAQMLCEETDGDACITTGVGQHQMWAAQWYTYDLPRRWASSGVRSVGYGRIQLITVHMLCR